VQGSRLGRVNKIQAENERKPKQDSKEAFRRLDHSGGAGAIGLLMPNIEVLAVAEHLSPICLRHDQSATDADQTADGAHHQRLRGQTLW
jgi:hypothetical protein